MTVAAVIATGVGIVGWLRWRVHRPPTWRFQRDERRAMRSIR